VAWFEFERGFVVVFSCFNFVLELSSGKIIEKSKILIRAADLLEEIDLFLKIKKCWHGIDFEYAGIVKRNLR
jgi:hypothetical protein